MKRSTNIRLLLLVYLLFPCMLLKAQFASYHFELHQTFQAFKNGKEIGWLRIWSYENGSEKVYKSESKLNFQMLLSFEAKALVCERFTGAVMTESMVYRTLNEKVKLDNEIQFRNGNYKVTKGEAAGAIKTAIRCTVVSLYFIEPVGFNEVFSEVYLCFMPIEKIAANVYRTPLPDGGVMTYTYDKGRLVKVMAETQFASVLFQLKQ